jgi:hypothetical protein
VKRHILAEHFIARQPNRGAPRTAEVVSKDVTTGDFSSFSEGRDAGYAVWRWFGESRSLHGTMG